MKFGGTSVANLNRIKKAAKTVKSKIIDEKQFIEIANTFRPNHLWKKNDLGEYELRHIIR